MTRVRATLVVAAVFVVGAVTGALGGVLLARHRAPSAGPTGQDFMAERLRRRLELSREQAARVEAIRRDAATAARVLRDRLEPEIRVIVEETERRIVAELSPVQRLEFEKLREEHGRLIERFLLGPGPPPGRGGRRERRRGRPEGSPPQATP